MNIVSTRSTPDAGWDVPANWRSSPVAPAPAWTDPVRPRTGLLRAALWALVEADRRHRERAAFARLPEHLRRDMGLPLLPGRRAERRW